MKLIPSYVIFIAADMIIGNKNTKSNKPMITVKATSINVGTPDGIKAAKVPPKIIAALITTTPILAQACKIL